MEHVTSSLDLAADKLTIPNKKNKAGISKCNWLVSATNVSTKAFRQSRLFSSKASPTAPPVSPVSGSVSEPKFPTTCALPVRGCPSSV